MVCLSGVTPEHPAGCGAGGDRLDLVCPFYHRPSTPNRPGPGTAARSLESAGAAVEAERRRRLGCTCRSDETSTILALHSWEQPFPRGGAWPAAPDLCPVNRGPNPVPARWLDDK